MKEKERGREGEGNSARANRKYCYLRACMRLKSGISWSVKTPLVNPVMSILVGLCRVAQVTRALS